MSGQLSRRDFVRLSGSAAAMTAIALPELSSSAMAQSQPTASTGPAPALAPYSELLKTWCDGLLAHQVTGLRDQAVNGGFLCPACAMVHGRCADAVYPILYMAHISGDDRYLGAARLVYDWSEREVSRADGSWVNDAVVNSWQGITVFRAIALAEALDHHGVILDSATRSAWTDRLARAAKFLDGFITIETGVINYPVTSSYAFALCGQVLDSPHYRERARSMAHAALQYFTENHLLFGEGHPQTGVSPKGCRPVDLGYNVEESLPALALYSLAMNDGEVQERVVAALRAHMEFMLPDGAWDNSWGTRNYKWTWWGSRTSDGCQPAYALLGKHDPRFFEVASRNLRLMAECTHDGLLYGGPDYFQHGDRPCIHHTFTHAKALATVLDRKGSIPQLPVPQKLPREEPYGLKSFPEIGTHLVSIGDWRATVTEYDFEYLQPASGGGVLGEGGHATGGALSLLFHQRLGTILAASMTEYQIIETGNQQVFRDSQHMTLTPRIEYAAEERYISLNDLQAKVSVTQSPEVVHFMGEGELQTIQHRALSGKSVRYQLGYSMTSKGVRIAAKFKAGRPLANAPRFILPVVSHGDEKVERLDGQMLQIAKAGGFLMIHCDHPGAFDEVPTTRTFNLVPGLECLPLMFAMTDGKELNVEFSASLQPHIS